MEWINCNDEFPDKNGYVLTYPHYIVYKFGLDEDGGIEGSFSYWDEKWETDRLVYPTHWMLLPEPPK